MDVCAAVSVCKRRHFTNPHFSEEVIMWKDKSPGVKILWVWTIGTAAVLVANVATSRIRDMNKILNAQDDDQSSSSSIPPVDNNNNQQTTDSIITDDDKLMDSTLES